MPDSAISMYEWYLATPSALGAFPSNKYLMAPFVHRRLGDLHAATGRKSDAIRHCSAHVTLHAGADRDVQPMVAEGRHRIAELRTRSDATPHVRLARRLEFR